MTFQGGIVGFYDITKCNPTSWTWEFQPSTISYFAGTTSNSQNPIVKFNEMGNYKVNLTASNANGTSTISKTDYITVSTDYYMNNDVITVYTGNFYDSQGPDYNYKDGEDYSITFIPAAPDKVLKFNFTTFDIEYEANCSYDYLEIYDGNSMSADLVSKYCGTNSPGVVTATNETGALTFAFHSDMGVNGLGWAASIECVDPSSDISKIVKNKEVNIYPNPSNGSFNINLKDLHSKTLYINIYNMQGKLLFTQKTVNVNGNYSQPMAMDKYAKGIFNIEIITDEKIIHKKIVLK